MDIRKLQKLAVTALEDIKAKDIEVINTAKVSAMFDRVIIATGEKIKTEDDFDAGSDYGLSHSRTYRSFGAGGTMFGAK